MIQLNLLDLLYKPMVTKPVNLELGVLSGEADITFTLPHKRLAWDQAKIELHQHLDGQWMWSVSFNAGNHGAGYKVGPKWGKFAESKSDALFYASNELRFRLGDKNDRETKLILEWLNSLHLGLV